MTADVLHLGCLCRQKSPSQGCTHSLTGMCRAEIDLASVEVRFQNLSIDADIAVGSRGEPTVLNAYRNKLEVNATTLCCQKLIDACWFTASKASNVSCLLSMLCDAGVHISLAIWFLSGSAYVPVNLLLCQLTLKHVCRASCKLYAS